MSGEPKVSARVGIEGATGRSATGTGTSHGSRSEGLSVRCRPGSVVIVAMLAATLAAPDGASVEPQSRQAAPARSDPPVSDSHDLPLGSWEGTIEGARAGALKAVEIRWPSALLEIRVRDRRGPVPAATVRIGEQILEADAQGRVRVTIGANEQPGISAWSEDHFIAHAGHHSPSGPPVSILLARLVDGDHRDYEWITSYVNPDQAEACQPCHSDERLVDLPFDGWVRSRHATAASNPRFLDTYAGTSAEGVQGRLTRYVTSRMYGRLPMLRSTEEPDVGPGFRLDWPDHEGNCAACHAPTAAVDSPYGVDVRDLEAAGREGVGCDFCHKIWDVDLDPSTGLPHPYRPGVVSYAFRRPPEGHQFFSSGHRITGRGGTFRQIQKQSAVCAPCHHAVFNGTVIYNSYGEWLDSAYADPEQGQSCQDCHMPTVGGRHLATPESGGRLHPPEQVRTHALPGANDPTLTRSSLEMTLTALREAAGVSVRVTVSNRGVGHHIPTGSPWRELILVVRARDSGGGRLPLLEGPVVPDWTEGGDSAAESLAGQAGKVYAKLLYSQWYGRSPAFDYWNPCLIEEDTRIPAHGSDTSHYRFAATATGNVSVEAEVIYRPVNRRLAELKGWRVADAVRVRKRLELREPTGGP